MYTEDPIYETIKGIDDFYKKHPELNISMDDMKKQDLLQANQE